MRYIDRQIAAGIIGAMDLLAIMLRTLLGVPLFLYLPGLVLDRLVGADAEPDLERHVGRVVVSVLLTGWLALLLAEIGWFSFSLLAVLLLVACAAALWLGPRRAGNMPWRPQAPVGIIADRGRAQGVASRWAWLGALQFDHLLLVIALVFAALVARPFEVVRGGLDAGVYANTGIAIARTGGIVQHDPLVAELGKRAAAGDDQARQVESNLLGTQNGQRYLATRLRAAGFLINAGDLPVGRVVPQFFHLWPTWIAVFVAMLNPTMGLVATGAAGTLGVVLLGLIGRRLGGAAVGLLAALFLALMTPQVWFSRMTTSEALAQALTLAGIWAFFHFAVATERRLRIWWGLLVGGAFGQLALTRIDFFLALTPLLALLGYVALTRRWHVGYWALALSMLVFLLHSALHTVLISRAYLIDTGIPTLQKYALTIYAAWPLLSAELQEYTIARPRSRIGDWPRLVFELGVVGLLVGATLALWRWPHPVRLLETLALRWRRLLVGAAVAGVGLLAAYAYLVRPEIITLDALLNPLQPANWLRLQGYVGAPIAVPFERFPEKPVMAIGLANMVRLGWYLSPLGVVLGVVGGLLLWWHVDRRSWLLLVVATLYAVFYIVSLQGTQDQTYIYILRRYVPVVYPAFALGIAYALGALRGGAASRLRPLWSGAAALLAASLVLFFVVTGRTVYAHVEYAGVLDQIEAISAQIGPDDVVLVRGGGPSYTAVRDTSDLVTAPLTYIFGRNALPIKGRVPGKYAAAFAEQVERWRNEGRRVFLLLAASGGDALFPGFAPQQRAAYILELTEFQQLKDQKPKLSYVNQAPFTLYELLPADAVTPRQELGVVDTVAQVAGFYPSEALENFDGRAAWTDGAAVLRLPATAQGQQLTVEADPGKRPANLGAPQVCLDVAPESVPYVDAGTAELPWQELRCEALPTGEITRLSAALPIFGDDTRLLLRLRSPTWVPAEHATPGEPASADQRPLGVRFQGAAWGEAVRP